MSHPILPLFISAVDDSDQDLEDERDEGLGGGFVQGSF